MPGDEGDGPPVAAWLNSRIEIFKIYFNKQEEEADLGDTDRGEVGCEGDRQDDEEEENNDED